MQQPLVHLYFITILEKLLRYSYDLPAMIKMIHKIGQVSVLLVVNLHWTSTHTTGV